VVTVGLQVSYGHGSCQDSHSNVS